MPSTPPIELFRKLGIVGGGIFFTMTGLANPFFTLYAQELGASTFLIGVLVTLRAVLPLVIAMPTGELIDSIGPLRMLAVGTACLVVSLVLNAMAEDIALLVLSQFFLGASIIISASSLQVLVSVGDARARNESIKSYSMWMSAGGMLGPLIGGAIVSAFSSSLTGYRAAFLTAAGVAGLFLLIVLALIGKDPQATEGNKRMKVRAALSPRGIWGSYRSGFDLAGHRAVQFGLMATFIIMYIQSMYSSFLPLFMDAFGYSTMMISAALAVQGLSAMLSRTFLNGAMARFSNETILTAAGFVASACVLLTPLAGLNSVSMLAVVFIMGAAVGLNLPVSIMIMVDAVGEGARGKLMGLRLLANRFSQILSPAMFGYLGYAFGLTAALYGGGVLLIGTMAGFSAYTRRFAAADAKVPPR